MTRILTNDMKKYNNEYYHNNLKDAYKEKVFCELCNKNVNLSSFKRHLTTSFHNRNAKKCDCNDNSELIERILLKLKK